MAPVLEFALILGAALFALVVHEYGHARAAFALGDQTAAERGRMTLNPLAHLDPLGTLLILTVHIGWARPVPVSVRRLPRGFSDFGLVALAGPAANVLVAVLAAGLFYVLEPVMGLRTDIAGRAAIEGGGLVGALGALLFWSVLIHLNLAFFNLIPVPPLDGSNIVRAFLPDRWAWRMGLYARHGAGVLLGVVLLDRYTEYSPLLWYLGRTSGALCEVLLGVNPFA